MLVLDIETAYDDRGFYTRELTIASILDMTTNRLDQYDINTVFDLVDRLPLADRVIGYNIASFDLPVLSQYAPQPLSDVVNAFDLYRDLITQSGRKDLQLDAIAEGTLGYALPQHGGDLMNLGQIRELRARSANGVQEIALIWRYGIANRFVIWENPDTQEQLDIPVT